MPKFAKVFGSGNSKAVLPPKEFRLDIDEVEISSEGDALILRSRGDKGEMERFAGGFGARRQQRLYGGKARSAGDRRRLNPGVAKFACAFIPTAMLSPPRLPAYPRPHGLHPELRLDHVCAALRRNLPSC